MCFKLIPQIILAFLFYTTVSCRWVGEKKPEPIKLEIKNLTTDCFTDIGGLFESYLKSELQDQELDSFFNCTEKAIDSFIRRTREQDPELGYSKVEIESLLRDFVINEDKKNDRQQSSGRDRDRGENNLSAETGEFENVSKRYSTLFLIVKRALVGGDSEHFHKSDWIKIKSLLPSVKRFLFETKPYMKYYYFYNREFYCDRQPKLQLNGTCRRLDDYKRLSTSHEEFSLRFNKFLSDIKLHGSALNKNEILILKDELVRLDHLKKVEPLFNEMIYIFDSFPTSEHPENWGELFDLAERGLRVMTYVKRAGLQKESYFVPEGGVAVAALVKSIIDAFELAFKTNSSNRLNQELIERFVLSLNQSGIFLDEVSLEDVKEAVSKIGKNIFSKSENSDEWFIASSKINQFKFMHNRWIYSLIDSLEKTSAMDLKDLYVDLLFTDVEDEANSKNQAEDIFDLIVKPSYVNLVSPGLETKINFQTKNSLSQPNVVKSNFYKTMMSNLVLFVFDTYGGLFREDQNENKYVVEQAAKNFYNDIRQIVVAEGLGSPLSCDAGGRTFLEANLFGYSSNGNDRIEVQEGLEWITMAVSSSSVANKIYNSIRADDDCVIPGSSQFQKRPFLKQDCVKTYVLENYKTHFNHLPHLVQFIDQDGMAENFYQNMFEVTRTCGAKELPVSYDEIVYSITLMGYIETLFERYDVETRGRIFTKPRNDYLEYNELENAFKDRFKFILQRMARMTTGNELSDSNAKHVFNKLLIYKRLPEVPNGTFESLMWLIQDWGTRPLPLDRIDVYKIFNSILTMNEVPAVGQEYCKNLKLAWERYLANQVFDVTVPLNTCLIQSSN